MDETSFILRELPRHFAGQVEQLRIVARLHVSQVKGAFRKIFLDSTIFRAGSRPELKCISAKATILTTHPFSTAAPGYKKQVVRVQTF
ncbi:MAG: hypothetical protein WCS01_05795 [bacterium]